ncbi:DUF3846 domain-containing protein [Mycobacterium intracellulare]|uniref:DUF3846 domain-containing protein n=1 Tax=Mycobacterium intracellulare TaxID=1767 RepID=UPI001EEE35BC|nr:DUF3846 domain-containing protein [Mycobacterium intracellulare]
MTDERGSAGALLREQIGCSWYDVIALEGHIDMWVDDEAIVAIDLGDRAALAEAMNIMATMIANRLGRPGPVFGAVVITGVSGASSKALNAAQLAQVEQLAEMTVALFADRLAARAPREIEGPIERMTLTLKLENAYSDGHCSTSVETVAVDPVDNVEKLWEQLEEFTGDGHGDGGDLGYCYTITVLEAPGHDQFVGLTNEWCGA